MPHDRRAVDAKCSRCDSRTCKCPVDVTLSRLDKLADDEDAADEAAADAWERANPVVEG